MSVQSLYIRLQFRHQANVVAITHLIYVTADDSLVPQHTFSMEVPLVKYVFSLKEPGNFLIYKINR